MVRIGGPIVETPCTDGRIHNQSDAGVDVLGLAMNYTPLSSLGAWRLQRDGLRVALFQAQLGVGRIDRDPHIQDR